jgi:hypothetical protein
LDFDWQVVELPRKQTTKMDDTFVGTDVLPLSAKDLETRIVRLGDIFDGGNQKCRKIVKFAREVEKKDLGILGRKRPPPEMGVRGPSPITTQRLKDQGIVIETMEIEDLAVERTRTRLAEGNDEEIKKSVGENFALLPGNFSH